MDRGSWRRSSSGFVAIGVCVAVMAAGAAAIIGRGNIDHILQSRNGGLFVHSSTKHALHHVDLTSGTVDFTIDQLAQGDVELINTGGVTVARNKTTGQSTVIDLSNAGSQASRGLVVDRGAVMVGGGGAVYALDTQSGTVTPLDPTTAATGTSSQAGGPIDGVPAVDDTGRLWTPVSRLGAVVPFSSTRSNGVLSAVDDGRTKVADAGTSLDVTVLGSAAVRHLARGPIHHHHIGRTRPARPSDQLSRLIGNGGGPGWWGRWAPGGARPDPRDGCSNRSWHRAEQHPCRVRPPIQRSAATRPSGWQDHSRRPEDGRGGGHRRTRPQFQFDGQGGREAWSDRRTGQGRVSCGQRSGVEQSRRSRCQRHRPPDR